LSDTSENVAEQNPPWAFAGIQAGEVYFDRPERIGHFHKEGAEEIRVIRK